MPSEKYSPFLFVFRVYFWPFSRLAQTTMASATGLPCASLHVPFTVPDAWAKIRGAHAPSASTANRRIAKCFLMLPPGQRVELPQSLQRRIRNWIFHSGRCERAQAQGAAVAGATG